MKQDSIRKSFERFLRTRSLKLTPQRARIFERAFATHEHFSAEKLYEWMRGEKGPRVSRATVYRTLGLLQEGGFVESLDTGRGELVYEHILGHRHHDHMVCLSCGRIEEFHDERIEALQREASARKGFVIVSHSHRLVGYCRACARKVRSGEIQLAEAEHHRSEPHRAEAPRGEPREHGAGALGSEPHRRNDRDAARELPGAASPSAGGGS